MTGRIGVYPRYMEDITRLREDINLFLSGKTVFYHEKIKFIYSSYRVIFLLLYRQADCEQSLFCSKIPAGGAARKRVLDKSNFAQTTSVRERNDVIDILTSEDMENTPLESRM